MRWWRVGDSKNFKLHKPPIRPYQGLFLAVTLQNVAKSIPGINIHLTGSFQPVGYLSATNRASNGALVDAKQATETGRGEGRLTRSG